MVISKHTRGVAAKWAAAVLAAGSAGAAFAGLGGTPTPPPAGDGAATVRTLSPSAARFAATGATQAASAVTTPSSSTASYTVRETTLGSGTVIREYVGTDGNVFGVAWQGPTRPDFTSLFGSYLASYKSGVEASHAAHGLRAPIAIDSSSLVVRSGGHMGAFIGSAWLPQALPAGVTGDDIQ